MKTTDELTTVLRKSRPSDIDSFLEKNREKLLGANASFGGFLKAVTEKNDLKLQDVFIAADIPERYGYKLVEGEKHTRNRDAILRLCAGVRMVLEETQKALVLNGMDPLYPRRPRDAVLMIGFNTGVKDASDLNELLSSHGMEQLSLIGGEDR